MEVVHTNWVALVAIGVIVAGIALYVIKNPPWSRNSSKGGTPANTAVVVSTSGNGGGAGQAKALADEPKAGNGKPL